MKDKVYTVRIYEQAHEYENVKATSHQEAELFAVERHNGGDYSSIYKIDIKRTCKCGYENEVDKERCDDCNKKL